MASTCFRRVAHSLALTQDHDRNDDDDDDDHGDGAPRLAACNNSEQALQQ